MARLLFPVLTPSQLPVLLASTIFGFTAAPAHAVSLSSNNPAELPTIEIHLDVLADLQRGNSDSGNHSQPLFANISNNRQPALVWQKGLDGHPQPSSHEKPLKLARNNVYKATVKPKAVVIAHAAAPKEPSVVAEAVPVDNAVAMPAAVTAEKQPLEKEHAENEMPVAFIEPKATKETANELPPLESPTSRPLSGELAANETSTDELTENTTATPDNITAVLAPETPPKSPQPAPSTLSSWMNSWFKKEEEAVPANDVAAQATAAVDTSTNTLPPALLLAGTKPEKPALPALSALESPKTEEVKIPAAPAAASLVPAPELALPSLEQPPEDPKEIVLAHSSAAPLATQALASGNSDSDTIASYRKIPDTMADSTALPASSKQETAKAISAQMARMEAPAILEIPQSVETPLPAPVILHTDAESATTLVTASAEAATAPAPAAQQPASGGLLDSIKGKFGRYFANAQQDAATAKTQPAPPVKPSPITVSAAIATNTNLPSLSALTGEANASNTIPVSANNLPSINLPSAIQAEKLAKPQEVTLAMTSETVAKLPAALVSPVEKKSVDAVIANAVPAPKFTIPFGAAETSLPPTAKEKLSPAVSELKANENLRATLTAYASAAGDQAATARRISLSRALAVRAYLIDQGISNLRINVNAEGSKDAGENADRVDVRVEALNGK